MRAVVFAGPDRPAELVEVPEPEADPGGVVVEVDACGLCGSDLHFWSGELRPDRVPRVIGHEVAGRVVATGPGVDRSRLGERVVLHPVYHCGRCRLCARGRTNICARPRILGFSAPGGFAERVAAPAEAALPVPGGVSQTAAAVAVEAGATVHHALVLRGGLDARSDRVLVIGVGGLGTIALMLLRALGADRVWAIDKDEPARERARRAGASIVPFESTTRELREGLGGGADLVVDFAGTPASIERGFTALDLGGRVVVVGVTREPLRIPRAELVTVGERVIVGSNASLPNDVNTMLELQSSGHLDLEQVVTERIALEELPAAIERMRTARGASVRVVAEPQRGRTGTAA